MGISPLLWEICLSAEQQEVPLFKSLHASHTTSLASSLTTTACMGTQQGPTPAFVPSNLPASLTDTRSCCIPQSGTGRLQKKGSHVHDGTKISLGGDKTAKAGPADYYPGKVRQPARLSSSALQLPALEHLHLLTGLLRTSNHLIAVTSWRTAGLLPCLGPKLSRGRPENMSLPLQLFIVDMCSHITSCSEGISRPWIRPLSCTGDQLAEQGHPATSGWS